VWILIYVRIYEYIGIVKREAALAVAGYSVQDLFQRNGHVGLLEP